MPARLSKVAFATLLGLLAVLLPLGAPPAGAEIKTMDLAMVEGGGTLTLRDAEEPTALEAPTTLTGSVDEFSGAISDATFSTAPLSFAFDITDPVDETVYVDAAFGEVVPGSTTGTVTKVPGSETLGTVTVSSIVEVDLHVEVGDPPIIPASDCTASPISLQMSGTYDSTTERVTLVDTNFTVPAVPVVVGQCDQIIADGVNERLAGGGHSISVTMEGDLSVPSIGAEPTATSLTVEPATTNAGDDVVLSATVVATPEGQPGTPTGFVEFNDGTTTIGVAALDGSGVGTLTTADLAVGNHSITAVYRGDPTYGRSTSAAVAHLVAATPSIDIAMPANLLIGGPSRTATITVTNPAELSAPVENARVDIAIAHQSLQATFDPTRIQAEWLDGSTWEPITLETTVPRAVGGMVGPATGFALPAATAQPIKVRLTAPAVPGDPSPTTCFGNNPTCPGRLVLTASLAEVDPGTGEILEPIAEDTHDLNLVESARRPSTFSFAGGVPRPHTVRQGYTVQLTGTTNPSVGGMRPTGLAEVYVDGAHTPVRATNAPLGSPYVDQIPLSATGVLGAFVLLPPDIAVGPHFVTVRYLGDAFFAPVDSTTTVTVLAGVGHPFICREEGFTSKIEVGANVTFAPELPAAAASGAAIPLAADALVLTMGRQFSASTSAAPWGTFPNGSTTPLGTTPLKGITLDLGPEGTGTAASLERQGGTTLPSSPNPATDATVDQTITLHEPTASVTVEGEPGDVVPVELEQITISSILSDDNPFAYTMTCTPVEGALELGEVGIAGTAVTAAPSPAREITDEVAIEADTFPADAAGTVSFSSDLDGDLGSDAVDAGEAELVTDELSPGTHVITASFDATDAEVPDTTGTATVVVTYSPRSGMEAFVVAARTDFIGSAEQDDVVADADDLDGGLSKAAYLTALSRTDQYLTHVVNEMYLDTLGRPGDEGGVAFWVGRLEAGWPVAKVAASFYSSNEYHARVGGTDAAWIDDLYQTLLGRPADASGRAYWVSEIPKRGRGLVALAFYQTPESGAFRVADLYDFFLDRAPSTADKAFWTPIVLRRGDLVLAVYLAASGEYADRAEERFPVVS